MKIKRRIVFISCVLCILLCLGGCIKKDEKDKVVLKVWSSSEDKDIIMTSVREFEKEYKNEADIKVEVMSESISDSKRLILNDAEDAADVFNYVDDQFSDIYNIGALADITEGVEQICKDNGGRDSDIIQKVTKGDKLYGYPLSDSNGYFLYYNSDYFTEDDVKDIDKILDVAQKNDKYFAMDWSSGWYTYSFFGGAGKKISVSDDGLHNICDFADESGKYSGIDIVNAMLDISDKKSFRSAIDGKIIEGIRDGEIIAAVNGTWNSKAIEEAWGESCAASKLPEFTINGEKVQMSGFYGYKYFGVNAHSKNKKWAMRLAKKISDYDTQMRRFDKIGESPSNINAKENEKVKNSDIINAVAEQKKYSVAQNICEAYWDPMSRLGVYLAAGNPDNADMSQVLENVVRDINK